MCVRKRDRETERNREKHKRNTERQTMTNLLMRHLLIHTQSFSAKRKTKDRE